MYERSPKLAYAAVAALGVGALVLVYLWGSAGDEGGPAVVDVPVADAAADPVKDGEDALMALGLDQMFTQHDPTTAIGTFRRVLAKNPEHYGARYQLASALDQVGRSSESRSMWAMVLASARQFHDDAVAEHARTRIIELDRLGVSSTPPDPLTVKMKTGLDALARGDSASAIRAFRVVLSANPDHYGAHYQLAVALDQAGDAAGARNEWSVVLTLAEQYADAKVMAEATTRLATR
jgi:Flp pilus assembly protein TadD